MVLNVLLVGKQTLPLTAARLRTIQPSKFVHVTSKNFAKEDKAKVRVPERGQPIDTSYSAAEEARKKFETTPETRRLNKFMFELIDINLGKLPGYHINAEYDIIRKEKKGKLMGQPTWYIDPHKPKKSST